MEFLLVIVFIIVVVFIIRKFAVIGVAIVFGTLILMISVTVLRDQLHLPVNDYVDTTELDNLRDKISPVTIGEEVVIVDEGKNVEKTKLEEPEELINYDLLTEEEIEMISKNLESNKNLNPKEAEKLEEKLIEGTKEDIKLTKKEETTKEEVRSNKHEYLYKELTEEKRKEIYNELSGYVNDSRFYEKLLGMSNYVDIKYDLGNGQMYNSEDRKSLIILINK